LEVTLELQVAAQDFVDQALVAEIEVADIERAAAERAAADIVELGRAGRVAAHVLAQRREAERLHDLFLDVEMRRHVRAQGLQLEPRLDFVARRQRAMRGIKAGQQRRMRLIKDRQPDHGGGRQAVGARRLGLVCEPAGDHFGEHACSPSIGGVMAFKVRLGERSDNSPRWSRPPVLPATTPIELVAIWQLVLQRLALW
jgi:hypothetical protein